MNYLNSPRLGRPEPPRLAVENFVNAVALARSAWKAETSKPEQTKESCKKGRSYERDDFVN